MFIYVLVAVCQMLIYNFQAISNSNWFNSALKWTNALHYLYSVNWTNGFHQTKTFIGLFFSFFLYAEHAFCSMTIELHLRIKWRFVSHSPFNFIWIEFPCCLVFSSPFYTLYSRFGVLTHCWNWINPIYLFSSIFHLI